MSTDCIFITELFELSDQIYVACRTCDQAKQICTKFTELCFNETQKYKEHRINYLLDLCTLLLEFDERLDLVPSNYFVLLDIPQPYRKFDYAVRKIDSVRIIHSNIQRYMPINILSCPILELFVDSIENRNIRSISRCMISCILEFYRHRRVLQRLLQ